MTITRGGSTLPCATPISAPIFSSEIFRSSRISTPRPTSFAMASARVGEHARGEAVGRLVDQDRARNSAIRRSRARFRRLRARLAALVRIKSRQRDGLDFAIRSSFRCGICRIRNRPRSDPRSRLRGSRTAFAFARKEDEFLHAAQFQISQRRRRQSCANPKTRICRASLLRQAAIALRPAPPGNELERVSRVFPVSSPPAASAAKRPSIAWSMSLNTPSIFLSWSKT